MQTWRLAHGAIDILHPAAHAADQMVVIVPNPILIPRRRPGRLNAPDEPLLRQDSEGIVHPLPRDGPNLGAHVLGNGIRRPMGTPRHRPKHGQSLRRHLDTMVSKRLGRICHAGSIDHFLDFVKSLN
jgi:hypothetical protein